MKKTLLLLIGACLCVCSCDTPEEAAGRKAQTSESFLHPEEVGVLPDGRIVKCVVRYNRNTNHYIYFVDNPDPKSGTAVSNNYSRLVGKTTVHDVTVEIDGVKYAPVEKSE